MPGKDLVFFVALPHLSDCVPLEAHMWDPFGVRGYLVRGVMLPGALPRAMMWDPFGVQGVSCAYPGNPGRCPGL